MFFFLSFWISFNYTAAGLWGPLPYSNVNQRRIIWYIEHENSSFQFIYPSKFFKWLVSNFIFVIRIFEKFSGPLGPAAQSDLNDTELKKWKKLDRKAKFEPVGPYFICAKRRLNLAEGLILFVMFSLYLKKAISIYIDILI